MVKTKQLIRKSQNLIQRVLGKVNATYYTRPVILFVQEQKKKNLVGLEIGTDKGINARNILSVLDIKMLYLVDDYQPVKYESGLYFDWSPHYKIAAQTLKNYRNQIKFIIKKSDKAVGDVPDNLDFVYIDGNHDYNFVKRDIELYYSKVKNGGVIGGHDFSTASLGVCKAVVEFAKRRHLKLYGREWDWWFAK